jgi:hypothetical protein
MFYSTVYSTGWVSSRDIAARGVDSCRSSAGGHLAIRTDIKVTGHFDWLESGVSPASSVRAGRGEACSRVYCRHDTAHGHVPNRGTRG